MNITQDFRRYGNRGVIRGGGYAERWRAKQQPCLGGKLHVRTAEFLRIQLRVHHFRPFRPSARGCYCSAGKSCCKLAT